MTLAGDFNWTAQETVNDARKIPQLGIVGNMSMTLVGDCNWALSETCQWRSQEPPPLGIVGHVPIVLAGKFQLGMVGDASMSLAGYSRWATWEKSILFDFIWDTQTRLRTSPRICSHPLSWSRMLETDIWVVFNAVVSIEDDARPLIRRHDGRRGTLVRQLCPSGVET